MKNLALISIGLTTAFQASALSFKTTIHANTIPKLFTTQKLPEINYSAPGEMSFNVKRMCGDGDVAHHEQTYTGFDYVPQEKYAVKAVLGSWIVSSGPGLNELPTDDNWVPLAYTDLSVPHWGATQVTGPMIDNYIYKEDWARTPGKFRLVNGLSVGATPAEKKIDGLNILKDNLPKMVSFTKEKFNKADNNYRIYTGIFVCVEPNSEEVLNYSDNFKASVMDIAYSFKDTDLFFNSFVDSQISSGSLANHLDFKVKDSSELTLLDDGASSNWSIFKEESGAGSLKAKLNDHAESAFKAAKKILEAEYPVNSTDPAVPLTLSEYNNKNRNTLNSHFSGVSNLIAENTYSYYDSVCNSFNLKTTSKYFWEKLGVMDTQCKVLSEANFHENMKIIFQASGTLPTEAIFNAAKMNAAKALYKSALTKAVQATVQSESAGNNKLKYATNNLKPHCIQKSDGHFIGKIIYSVPIMFSSNDGKWKVGKAAEDTYSVRAVHPEPLFALRNFFDEYTTASGDYKTIFGMVNTPSEIISDPRSIAIPTNSPNEFDASTFNRALDVEVHIRSVGGACPIFC